MDQKKQPSGNCQTSSQVSRSPNEGVLTLAEKRDRLRKLKSEVPHLHDWLHVLFEKMPHVVYVEYTHGRNEFGADFVIELTNPTTGRNEFVGVVVKKGTIKQDTTEVERQISECGIPRVIKHGKDEQSLPVIWVISNEGITGNAEKKIRHTYRQHAIHFFDADDIVRWTDAYASHLWEELPSKVGKYLRAVFDGLRDADRASALLAEEFMDVKLELDLAPVDPDKYRKAGKGHKNDAVNLSMEVCLRRIVFLEGQMGAGKSQILRDLGKELCSSTAYTARALLPIFSTYRNLAEMHAGSLSRLMTEALGELQVELTQNQAEAVILIDGLDEVSDSESCTKLLEDLAAQIRHIKGARLVLTCRSGVVPTNVLTSAADLRHLEVRPVSIRKMTNFIKQMCERAQISNRVARDIGKSDLFRQLPQNPIAGLLLTRLMLQANSRDELPQTLAGLYSKALELMLGRWDLNKGLGSQQEYDVSQRICGEVARLMIENQLTAIGINEIQSRLHEYLTARNLSVNEQTLLDRLFSRSGVFAVDPQRGTATFKHRSFAEYFCAEEWIRTNSFHVDGRALDAYWSTVYFFAIGQLSDCESVLKDVLGLHPVDGDQRLGKIIAAPGYLLAGHMTPYRVVESSFANLMLEAARFYVDTLSGHVPSALIELSPVSLLYILQFIIREKYSYQFFSKAIDEAALTISDAIEDDKVKAYALFFLGVIGIDLGNPEAMRFVASKFKASDLPIGLANAIVAEAEAAQPRGMLPVLRFFNKRVHKMLKDSRSLRDALRNEFHRPVSQHLATSRDRERKSHDRAKRKRS